MTSSLQGEEEMERTANIRNTYNRNVCCIYLKVCHAKFLDGLHFMEFSYFDQHKRTNE